MVLIINNFNFTVSFVTKRISKNLEKKYNTYYKAQVNICSIN